MVTCNFCGIHSRIIREGNGCHSCQRGWMVRDEELELDIKEEEQETYKRIMGFLEREFKNKEI